MAAVPTLVERLSVVAGEGPPGDRAWGRSAAVGLPVTLASLAAEDWKGVRMPAWSIVPGATAAREVAAVSRSCALSGESWRKINPGLVQNWPTPIVTEVARPLAMVSARSLSAPGR